MLDDKEQGRAGFPSGTVTFMLTDVQGSTRLWEQHPAEMSEALKLHDRLIADRVDRSGGMLVKPKGEGDSTFSVFARASDGLECAHTLLRDLRNQKWPEGTILAVRFAVHTGEAEYREGDYFGGAVSRASRLRSAAHGGQALISQSTFELVRDQLPEDVKLKDLGMHRLKDLARSEHVYQVLHPELPAEFPVLQTLDSWPNNLPEQLTSFIGREKEMSEVKELLEGTRLLTLTGAGGSGKSRLSLQVAADLLDRFPDGVWLVELAPLTEGELVPQAVAQALGLKEETAPEVDATGAVRAEGSTRIADQVIDHLRDRSALIVLDNCEHLVEASAGLADALLRSCPSVKIIATSREPLGVSGETSWRVPSLSLPDLKSAIPVESMTQFEAVRLFIDRAVQVNADFAVTSENAPAVAQICHRLDGIPLAIELAAARVKVLTPEQISARLDDRFRLLTGGSRTALPRQQTLQALVDWSYQLLTEPERLLLRRLSVFLGGFTLEAAEGICSGVGIEGYEVLDLVSSLVDKSLILMEERGGAARYRLIETIRQFAREKLLEAEDIERLRIAHRDFYLAVAESLQERSIGEDQKAVFDLLESEHDNLRAAIEWSLSEKEPEPGVRLAASLWRFWWVRGYPGEGRRWLAAVVARNGSTDGAVMSKALRGAGMLAEAQGDPAAARDFYEKSADAARDSGDRAALASALALLGYARVNTGVALSEARSLTQEALAMAEEAGDPDAIGWALHRLGNLACMAADYALGKDLFERSLQVRREMHDKRGIARSLNALANLAIGFSTPDEAKRLLQESLELVEGLGFKEGVAQTQFNLGLLSQKIGDFDSAEQHFQKVKDVGEDIGAKYWMAQASMTLARLASFKGDRGRARDLLESALGVAKSSYPDMGAWVLNAWGYLEIEDARPEEGRARFEEALALLGEGADQSTRANILHSIGEVALRRGDLDEARRYLEEAKRIHETVAPGWAAIPGSDLGTVERLEGHPDRALDAYRGAAPLLADIAATAYLARCIDGIACLATDEGNHSRSARLFGAAESLRNASDPLWRVDPPPGAAAAREAARTALGDEAFLGLLEEGKRLTTSEALALALGD